MGKGASAFLLCTLRTKIISFSKVSTFVLKLFLIFGQSEPLCSYKVVLINKSCKLFNITQLLSVFQL